VAGRLSMIGDDIQQIFEGFGAAADAYFDSPGVLQGMELDERAGQLRRVCPGKLRDTPLGSRLHDFQKRVRSGDLEAHSCCWKSWGRPWPVTLSDDLPPAWRPCLRAQAIAVRRPRQLSPIRLGCRGRGSHAGRQ